MEYTNLSKTGTVGVVSLKETVNIKFDENPQRWFWDKTIKDILNSVKKESIINMLKEFSLNELENYTIDVADIVLVAGVSDSGLVFDATYLKYLKHFKTIQELEDMNNKGFHITCRVEFVVVHKSIKDTNFFEGVGDLKL
jgi:hypothetical protein